MTFVLEDYEYGAKGEQRILDWKDLKLTLQFLASSSKLYSRVESKEEMIEMMDKIPGSFRTILNSEVQLSTEYSFLTRSSVQNDDGGEDQGGEAEHSHQLQAGGGEGYP